MNATDKEDLDLIAICRMLWSYKLLIALVCTICGLVAAWQAVIAPSVYRAEVVVTAVREGGSGGGAAALASQLGGLAGLSGLNLSQSGNGSQAADAILESRRLVEEFIKRNDLTAELFRNAKTPPTLWLAVKKFKEGVIAIRKDTRKGVTVVTVEWTDPAVAARWANAFVALANELIRTRALDESKRNIAYLNGQIGQTSVLELRQVMYNIIASEAKTLMLANGRLEYAFQVVDPAVPAEIRIRPHRALMVLVGLALGLFIGVITAFILDGISRRKLGVAHSLPEPVGGSRA